jgi:hypothetical protein
MATERKQQQKTEFKKNINKKEGDTIALEKC